MVRAMKKNKCGKEISALSCKEIRKASQMRYFEQRPEWRKTVSPVTQRVDVSWKRDRKTRKGLFGCFRSAQRSHTRSG